MTVMRLIYQRPPTPGRSRPGRPPERDLERSDIVELSGAGFGHTVREGIARWPATAEPDRATKLAAYLHDMASWATFGGKRREFSHPATADAPVGSASWLAKIDAFVTSCVANGDYSATETDDVVDHQGGI